MNEGSNNPFPVIEDNLGEVSAATGSETWVEDVYGDGAWMSPDATASSAFIGLAANNRRLVAFSVALIVLIGVLWVKTGILMAQSGSFKARSDMNRIRAIVTPAPRGTIFDRNGVQLTDNVPDLQLAVVPADLPADETARSAAVAKISTLAGVDPAASAATLNDFGVKGYQPVMLAANIGRDQAVDLTIAKNDYPAIRIENGTHRFYGLVNTLPSLAHLLGYMGRITADDMKKPAIKDNYQPTDPIGRTGLEYVYESELVGKPGVKKVEVDAMGNEVGTVGQTDPVPGSNLRLTLDAGLTAAAEASLKAMMDKTHLTRGAVVVEDVKTGGILTLISLPSFSNNDFSQGISSAEYKQLLNDPDHPLFNRAISGMYPPGSTAKLMVASGALAEGVITPDTTVNSVGGIHLGQWFFPDWKAGGHGITNVTKAIAWSVNTFFYTVGGGYQSFVGLGIDRLDKYFSLFGIGKPLGIDLPNEAAGFVPTPAWKKTAQGISWYIGDTYHVSIGQGDLLVTPLQMASWTATVANGGTVWQPHLADAFVDDSGKVIKTYRPTALATHIVDDKYLATVREGMRETVTGGSAQSLKAVAMDVAGKTGTAQVSGKDNHAWFTGFGPYEDPQIAVMVLIEQGKEGSTVSVPVARDIFDWWAKNRMKHGQ
jgi:penicillin-binding protein 2